MLMLLLIFLPMGMAAVCTAVGSKTEKTRDLLTVVTAAVELALAVALTASPNGSLHFGSFCGLGLRLETDGFRKLYSLVIAFLWLMTLLFSKEYFAHYHNRNRYYFFNLMTLGATMGVFFGADLVTAFLFFEIMSFTSYVWVIHEQTPGAIRAANTYLAVAVIGGLVTLMGLFLLQWKLGTTELSVLWQRASACGEKGTLYLAGGCILFGFGAKAGMFPLHIWLPKAHPVAPAPASALLSGILTKSGIWGVLAISCNLFRNDPAWGALILFLGTVTMLLGALLALFSIDLKRTLACSSMSQIGFILVGIGMMELLGTHNTLAARGALLHMMNHSLFKLVLFVCAGVVYMNLHALDLNEIRGFGRKKPLLKFAFLMGMLGIGGIPGWSGYISKTLLHESIVEGTQEYGTLLSVVEWLFLLSGGLTLAYMTKLFVALFVKKHPQKQREYDEKQHYISSESRIALLAPAVMIPALGLSASDSMDALADLGTDFFQAGVPVHAVQYFSAENLKGALISLVIGAAVYFLVVRKLLCKDGRYMDRWPKKLDLETALYRPMLQLFAVAFGKILAVFGENRVIKKLSGRCMMLAGRAAALFAENRVSEQLSVRMLKAGLSASRAFAENHVTEKIAKATAGAGEALAASLGENSISSRIAARTMQAGLGITSAADQNKATARFGKALLQFCEKTCVLTSSLPDLVFYGTAVRLLRAKRQNRAK